MDLEAQGMQLPILLRFSDILRRRIETLSEGFAQYFAALYAQKTRGERVFGDMLRQFRRFAIDQSLTIFAPNDSRLAETAATVGLRVIHEVFADRNYLPDGTLVHRSRPDALLHDPDAAAERVLRMLRENRVRAIDGSDLPVTAETICIHGDNPAAGLFAKKLRENLVAAGIAVAAPGIR